MARAATPKTKSFKDDAARSVPPKGAAAKKNKASSIIALLKSKRGATIPELMEATGWQAHSVRGFLAGALRKRHGLEPVSEKRAGETRRYRAR
jgi:hypothetical protein